MLHYAPLLMTIAVGLVMAFILGFAAQKAHLSPIVGYLAAGVVIGPFTPGYVGDVDIAAQLAEIGVILLMFGVGLHFSIKDLLAVKRVAVPGAIVQMLVATALGAGLGLILGWSLGSSLLVRARAVRRLAPWCCCERLRIASCSTPAAATSPSAG